MATYFHGSSEFQAASASTPDGMQTLYLMNPNYVPYSDTHQPGSATNMFFLNPAGNALNPTSLPHAPPPPSHHHLLGLPFPTPTSSIVQANSDDPNRPSSLHGIVSGGIHYNLWGSSIDHQNSPGRTSSHLQPQVVSVAANSGGSHDVASQLGLRRPGPVVSPPRQGLSLSLSSQQVPYRSSNNVETDIQRHDMRKSGNSPSSVSVVSNGISGVQSVVFGSKYLRAAQELLDEVINVGKGIKTNVFEGSKEKIKMNKESVAAMAGGEGSSGGKNGAKRGAELTTAQKQELQMKKAKLVSMFDEVEQRYRRYHQQMQIVVSSFEQAAGFGAAKPYTALALQTISKQFRCLKDAISEQIKATSKSLGEEEYCLLGTSKVEGSKLRYVDHELRQQQRALQQQLGMIQHNNIALRPQRGLPERAVSVLRAWLFEHFLHPYPKDSDKHMLAKQTGLTKSQVSNWFINARVRLWKPMVEEMYLEEVKEQETNCSTKDDKASKIDQQKESRSSSSSAAQQESVSIKNMDQVIKTLSKPDKSINPINIASPTEFSNSKISTISPMGGSFLPQTAFNLIGSSDQRSSKKPRSSINELQNSPSSFLSMDMETKQGETIREININFGDDDQRLSKDESYSFLTGTTANHGGAWFDPEHLTPRLFHGNSSVSLTLGLPHCENLSLSGNQQNFLSNQNTHQLGKRLELGPNESDFCGINSTQQASHSNTGYDNNIEMQNRKLFAAQLLPDFVA